MTFCTYTAPTTLKCTVLFREVNTRGQIDQKPRSTDSPSLRIFTLLVLRLAFLTRFETSLWRAVGPRVLYAPTHAVSTFNCEIRALWQRMMVAVMRVSSVDRDPRSSREEARRRVAKTPQSTQVDYTRKVPPRKSSPPSTVTKVATSPKCLLIYRPRSLPPPR